MNYEYIIDLIEALRNITYEIGYLKDRHEELTRELEIAIKTSKAIDEWSCE